MEISTFDSYRKNNYPAQLTEKEVEDAMRARGFCKTVQETKNPVILTPSERAQIAILDFEGESEFLETEEIVYSVTRGTKQKPSKIVVFYK